MGRVVMPKSPLRAAIAELFTRIPFPEEAKTDAQVLEQAVVELDNAKLAEKQMTGLRDMWMARAQSRVEPPIPMRLHCPECGGLHLDEGEFATKPHHTHACQHCGAVWRPAIVATVGVRFLPGFKNEEK